MVSEYLAWREEKRQENAKAYIETYKHDLAEARAEIEKAFDTKFGYTDSNKLTKVTIDYKQLKQVPIDLFTVNQQLSMMDTARKTLDKQTDTVAKLSLISSLDKDIELKLGQIISAEAADSAASSQKDKAGKSDAAPVVVVPEISTSKSTSPRWEDLDRDRRNLSEQIRSLSFTYLPGHPKVSKLQKQLDAVNEALDMELQFALNRFNLQYANLIDKKKDLEAKINDYNSIQKQYEKIRQELGHFDVNNLPWYTFYSDMQKRLLALDFGSDKERAQIQFRDHVEIKERPISPNRSKLLIMFLALGVALAVAVPFLLEYIDSRIADVDEAEQLLRIRGLGVVPKIDEPTVQRLLLTPASENRADYHLQENFRVIRTNIVMTAEASGCQVILITSAMPQEGKTVVSSNLALSFATKGERTLIIDADLRRGRLHRVFGVDSKPGLSDLLRGKATLEEVCRPTSNQNLTMMSCGKHLNSAAELLDNASFGTIIETLRKRYDRIIIDTPPVLGLAETAIIQRFCDGVLFVIWSEMTPMRNVKAAIQSLQSGGAKFAGFVLNRLDFHALGNRYKYFYYAPNYYTNYKAIEAPAVVES
jgi:capsular exopolysaccharide synthesis family protein